MLIFVNVIAREYSSVLLLSWAFCHDATGALVQDCNVFDRFPIKERESNAVAQERVLQQCCSSAYAALSPNPPKLNLKMKM